MKERYENGVNKLIETNKSVNAMKKDIEEKKPGLEKAQKDTAELMVVVEENTKSANIVKEKCAIEEATCKEEEGKVTLIKDDCEAALALALPALAEAEKAVKSITKGDIDFVKGLKTVSDNIKDCIEVIVLFFKPWKGFALEKDAEKKLDYWGTAKKHLLNNAAQLLNDLVNFPRDDITDDTIATAKKKLDTLDDKKQANASAAT